MGGSDGQQLGDCKSTSCCIYIYIYSIHFPKYTHTCSSALQFHGAPDFYEAMLKNLNIVFTTLFSLECILKIIAFGPLVSNIYERTLNIRTNKEQPMIFNCCSSELLEGCLERVWLCHSVGQHHRHPGDWNQCKSSRDTLCTPHLRRNELRWHQRDTHMQRPTQRRASLAILH